LFHATDGNVVDVVVLSMLQEVVVHLARAQHHTLQYSRKYT
jgi:hypothetical protein